MGGTQFGGTQFGGTMISSTPARPAEGLGRRSPENLALIYQEIITAIERLRAGRQRVDNAALFRQQIKSALKSAEQEAVSKGYPLDDARLATYALVAFLDESVQSSQNPAFADWSRELLQQELYNHTIAGEVFFENLDRLVLRPDSHQLADLLEVYALCILLGFRGRYSEAYGIRGGPEAVRPVLEVVMDKIRRARGTPTEIAPGWAPPSQPIHVTSEDPWVKRLLIAAVASVLLAVLLFGGFKFLLHAGISDLRSTAAQSRVQ
jgi:type VI secretion system protein ImpK